MTTFHRLTSLPARFFALLILSFTLFVAAQESARAVKPQKKISAAERD